MKKLGKKVMLHKESLEAYACSCSTCTCGCGCSCGGYQYASTQVFSSTWNGAYGGESSSDGYSSNYTK